MNSASSRQNYIQNIQRRCTFLNKSNTHPLGCSQRSGRTSSMRVSRYIFCAWNDKIKSLDCFQTWQLHILFNRQPHYPMGLS